MGLAGAKQNKVIKQTGSQVQPSGVPSRRGAQERARRRLQCTYSHLASTAISRPGRGGGDTYLVQRWLGGVLLQTGVYRW